MVSAALARLTTMTETLSASAARRVALAAQGFGRDRPTTVTTRALRSTFTRMGITQIDSVNVFSRSHYMPYFSRLGSYDTSALDRLFFGRRGPYTEYWAHVATLIPIEDWGLWRFRMDANRAKYLGDDWAYENDGTIQWVRAELAARGPLRPAEIEDDAHRAARGPWWDWSAVKVALERMFLAGDVAIAGRRGFERRYALAEHVIPSDALDAAVPYPDAIRELVRRAMRSYGVATAADIADYYRVRDRGAIMTAIRELEDAGEIRPLRVEGWQVAGRPAPAWIHADQRVPRRVDAAALLTPFDPVVWFRDRAARLFDFDYRIEIYTPEPKRVFGYYSLPVLAGDTIIGRIDLKADRAASRLLVQSAWWEHESHREQADRIAAEIRLSAQWQGLESISVGTWGDAADDIAGALGSRSEVPRHTRGS